MFVFVARETFEVSYLHRSDATKTNISISGLLACSLSRSNEDTRPHIAATEQRSRLGRVDIPETWPNPIKRDLIVC